MSPDTKTRKKTSPSAEIGRDALSARFSSIRAWSDELCEPLVVEDLVVQSMPDASPLKWHLAHTTWFFETLILKPHLPGYRTPNETFEYLFNSYYNSIGKQYSRPERGVLSRPTVAEVREYRLHVDENMAELLDAADEELMSEIVPVLEVGLNHEQQHQELMITDLKHMFSKNPLHPVYRAEKETLEIEVPALAWHLFEADLCLVGHEERNGFAYDNEGPRHRVFLEPFGIASRLVTSGEYLEFMADGGYERPEFWLADGWAKVQAEGWDAPLYWLENGSEWKQITLAGLRSVRSDEPVCHVSLYEADAYARWAGARLPSEEEWEVAANRILGRAAADADAAPGSNFVEDGHYHPRPLTEADSALGQFLGDVWEWTRSAYSAYPGYRAPDGPLGEYNSKFMSSQIVLRGGSCATPRSHIRTTYRNFFPPQARWQFMGLRLAQDG